MDWEYLFARIKRYFLRLLHALIDKDLKSSPILSKKQKREFKKRQNEANKKGVICNIFAKTKILMKDGKIKYFIYDGEIITSTLKIPKNFSSKKEFKIHEKYLHLFGKKEQEFIQKELIYHNNTQIKTIKRTNGKPLQVQITQHARERFLSRTLLIEERLPNFNFPPYIRSQIEVFKEWIKEELANIDREDKRERDGVLYTVATTYKARLNELILECLKHSTYSNEKSKHYRYRDKKGNTNYYRIYPYTFVFNIENNQAMTTEIYAIVEDGHNRPDLVAEVNTKTYNLFDNYLDKIME